MRFFSSVLVIIACAAFCLGTAVYAQQSVYSDGYPADLNFWSDYPDDELAEAIIGRMTDEELLAQVLMFGWSGDEPTKVLYQWIAERGVGSVKLYGWNTDNIYRVTESVASLQQKSVECRFKIPLFVATDQEGGWIRHVKGEMSDTPGNLAIGASGYLYDAYYSGYYYIGRELNALGINNTRKYVLFCLRVELVRKRPVFFCGVRKKLAHLILVFLVVG